MRECHICRVAGNTIWYVSSRSGEAISQLLYSVYLHLLHVTKITLTVEMFSAFVTTFVKSVISQSDCCAAFVCDLTRQF